MKVATHALVGASVGLVFAPDAACFAACVIGSVTPDYLDLVAARLKFFGRRLSWDEKVDIWAKLHRTWSHNLFYWLLILFAILLVPFVFAPVLKYPYMKAIILISEYFCIGALSHVFCDFLTPMGVGYLPLMSKTRISARLVKTNSWLDIFFGVFCFVLAAAYFVIYRNPAIFANLRNLWS